MAKERLHELKQTESSFTLRGVVSGTKSQRFYRNGNTKSGGTWNAIEFGVKIGDNKTIFCTLNGFPRSEVFYYKKGENGAKGDTKRVAWKDRKKSPGAGYRLIGVNLTTGKDDEGKNINETFTEFDAVEWLHDNLSDGDSVFIKGNLRFNSYTDKNGNSKRNVELVPTQISYSMKPIDFNEEGYEETAEFEDMLVFSSVEKETDEFGKATGRFILSGYSIGYSSIEPVSFFINKEAEYLAKGFKKSLKPGYAIKVFGKVDVVMDVSAIEDDDDSWGIGKRSPLNRMNTPVRREYVVYDAAKPSTVDKETYTEEAIADAIRKINAAQKANENFGDKAKKANIDIAVDDDWGSGGFDDDDTPWGDE